MQDATALVFSDYSAGHETGSHPENQARYEAVVERLHQGGLLGNRAVYHADRIEPETVAMTHDMRLIDTVREICERGGGAIDGDTFVSPGSYDAALGAAGAAVESVKCVLGGMHQRAFSIARPPGHHAERARQMGFCLFNNVAIAANYAIREHGLSRVAIIDWDVHHGNGTQDIFYESSDVLFMSIHQWPLFPGSGLENERGIGRGNGYTINVPLPPGAEDRDYEVAMKQLLSPAVHAFEPDLILVSAGFDAHRDDPLAMMDVSTQGFAMMAREVSKWAETLTDGKLVLLLEGGYNLRALSESVVAVLDALDISAPIERGQ